MLSYYKSVFSFTTVIYPINQMFYPVDSQLNINPATQNQVQMDVAEWAVARGMGIGQEGLLGYYTTDYAEFPEIAAWVNQHYPDTYIQFQTVAEVSNSATASCDSVCVVENDIKAAGSGSPNYGGRSIEWYSPDDLSRAYQSDFALWQQYVNLRFG
jgi:hypothetical protein